MVGVYCMSLPFPRWTRPLIVSQWLLCMEELILDLFFLQTQKGQIKKFNIITNVIFIVAFVCPHQIFRLSSWYGANLFNPDDGITSVSQRLEWLCSWKRPSFTADLTGPSSTNRPLCHPKNHMLLFPSSLQLLQLIDDLYRYLTAEKVFSNCSNYTFKGQWSCCKSVTLIWNHALAK